MDTRWVFVWGFLGSVMVDFAAMECARRETGRFPDRYYDPRYIVVRVIIAFSAGAIAVAQGAQQPVAALQIGASAPLILRGLAQGTRSTVDRRTTPTRSPRKDPPNYEHSMTTSSNAGTD
jgi:hypothetical protein